MSSWSPNWAAQPSGLSPGRPPRSIFDSSHPHHGYLPSDTKSLDAFKSALSVHPVDRPPARSHLPPPSLNLGPIGPHRSVQPLFAGLPIMMPSSIFGSQYSSLLRRQSVKSDYRQHAPSNRPGLPSPMEPSSYSSSPMAVSLKARPSLRMFDQFPYASPSLSPQPPLYVPSTYLNLPPKRSKAAIAAEDWDHPSFARPPHRAVEPQMVQETTTLEPDRLTSAIGLQPTPPVTDRSGMNDGPLVPSIYPVPPPPPYEQSAAPLSDLAAEMVWERCYYPKAKLIGSPTYLRSSQPWDSTFPWSTPDNFHSFQPDHNNNNHPIDPIHQIINASSSVSWITPSVPVNNTYGVIGAEAKARKFNQQYSLISPPHSEDHSTLPSINRRKLSIGTTRVEVKPAFRRWIHQVLEHTLLSPQVLLLALYYVDRVSGTDVFGDQNAKTSLSPYKMLLAALVVANKTLDDHSYRNSTFANVSSMTNAEVNAIEVALLSSLKFDAVPSTESWSTWLKEVLTTGQRIGFSGLDLLARVTWTSQPIRREVVENLSPGNIPGYVGGHGSIFDQAPTPPGHRWHSSFEPLSVRLDSARHLPSHSPAEVKPRPQDPHHSFVPAVVNFECNGHRDYLLRSHGLATDFAPAHPHHHHQDTYVPKSYAMFC